jgi:hypothetical protein
MIATDEINDHQARCRRHLRTLAMLARDEDDRPPAVAEVCRVTAEIFAEAEASARAALAAADGAHPGTWTLLLARLNRLATTAAEVVAAARDGDTAALRRHVRRLETVASAIWTVQYAVCGPAPQPRPAPDDMLR